jgi:hypothetical protein
MVNVEIAKAGLYELQSGLAALGEQAPELVMIEAFWSWVDADLSSAGFVGLTSAGTRIYFEVNCRDDTEEREVETEIRTLDPDQRYPLFNHQPPTPWSDETDDLNLWLTDLEDGPTVH